MPLSEEELRLLEQMERALAEEDPKFVSTIQGTRMDRAAKIRAIAAGAVFLLGVALLLGGAMAQQTWLGILGFVVMLASAVIGLTAWRGRTATASASQAPHPDLEGLGSDLDPGDLRLIEGGRRPRSQSQRPGSARRHPPGPSSRPAKPRRQGTFMQRMEQRWQDRRNRGGH